ncbi:hypothetical protein P153DRAFT_399188 [Dothidotthia symphoricarpi CBS 119687]|uniref:Uncharacterized protein n=1 Tax=Dothidotthia symphoricarpi CBS 119687 TaxID=1392245 RepID=A0A6A6A5G6_9PLEO|nr:uncharacterized protein P153DRAFT_399188 [Dothidotthia symphoricarpi CBS 119687]KAF2126405.1 hypothetical protein P153DRAFT_399188 [Dothidotthia symphoricarpi CBS 119687]
MRKNMFLQRSQRYGLLEASRRPLPRKSWQQSNLLVYLILFFGVVNVVEALLIWLGSGWSKQAIDSSVLEPVYRESINTVRRPLYPERLYDASLTARAVDEIVDRYATDQKIIALPHGEKLLRSIPFPWDSTMDAFALAGYHSLHSIQLLYHAMLLYASDNRTISDASLHSLIVLWEDTLCNVDLTPLSFAGDVVSNETAIKAAGQMRFAVSLSGPLAVLMVCTLVYAETGLELRGLPQRTTHVSEDLLPTKAISMNGLTKTTGCIVHRVHLTKAE